jgi:hypothetical protein
MRRLFVLVSLFASSLVTAGQATETRSVTESELLAYASTGYDKATAMSFVFGSLNGAVVFVDFICSDVCPDATVRIIHLRLAGSPCTAAGGIERLIRVPVAIASMQRPFCIPKVLSDHWNQYRM